jgi:hypothetical protein
VSGIVFSPVVTFYSRVRGWEAGVRKQLIDGKPGSDWC